MIEIAYGILVVFYLIFWVYSLFKVIQNQSLSSRSKLILILLLVFLQPIGLLIFWSYAFLRGRKQILK
jgi:hypothetical protein